MAEQLTNLDPYARDKINRGLMRQDALDAAINVEIATRVAAVSAEGLARQAADAAEAQSRRVADLALPIAAALNHRPGDAAWLYTQSLAAGEATLEPLPVAMLVTSGTAGSVAQIAGSGVVATRALHPVEPGRTYRVEFAARRVVDASDPTNDTLRCAVEWYGAGKAPLGQRGVVQDFNELLTSSGRIVATAQIARDAGTGVTVVAPAAARYARLYCQQYGVDATTQIEDMRWLDVTDLALWSPDITAITGRIGALESLSAGARLNVVEQALIAPKTVRFATRAEAVSAAIPATASMIEVMAYAASGDNGGGLYKEAMSAPIAPGFANAGRYWTLVDPAPRPEQFGAKGDGVVDDRAALLALRDYCVANGVPMSLLARRYMISGSAVDLSAITMRAEAGATLVGVVDLALIGRTDDPVMVNVDSAGIRYPYRSSRMFRAPPADRAPPLSARRETAYTALGATTLVFEKSSWPSDVWTTINPTVAESGVTFSISSGGEWHCAFAPAPGGTEIAAAMPTDGEYMHGLFIRTVLGYYCFYAGATGMATLAYKPIGGGLTQTDNRTWIGQGTYLSYDLSKSHVSIVVIDSRRFAIRLNGVEAITQTIAAGDMILDAGFGFLATSTAVSPRLAWPTLARVPAYVGKTKLDVAIFGDSMSAEAHGAWSDEFRAALDGAAGIRIGAIVNRAVPGENTANMIDRWRTQGVAGATVAIWFGGTNDVQGGSALSASLGNYKAFLIEALGAGLTVIAVVPPLWYPRTLGDGDDFNTSNYEKGAELRAMMLAVSAANNVPVVDLPTLLGPIVDSLQGADGVLRDSIHPTARGYQLIGRAIAQTLINRLAPCCTGNIATTTLPASGYRNGWTAGGEAPKFSVLESSGQRRLMFAGGYLAPGGTTANGTIIYQLPRIFRPPATMRIKTLSGSPLLSMVEVNTSGEMRIYGLGSGTFVSLDGEGLELA